jgi:hypothetical protein
MKELRIPLLNKAPWYEKDGSEVPIVRTGKDSFRLGEGLTESEIVSVTGSGDDAVTVIARYLIGNNAGTEMAYLFTLSDWERRRELDIISPD